MIERDETARRTLARLGVGPEGCAEGEQACTWLWPKPG
jgi:hypothetical protein